MCVLGSHGGRVDKARDVCVRLPRRKSGEGMGCVCWDAHGGAHERGLVGKGCVCWDAKGGRARERRRQPGMCVWGRA